MSQRPSMKTTELSTHLKNRRLEFDISQAQLARLSGIPQSTISRIEQGYEAVLEQKDLAYLLRIVGLDTTFGEASGLNDCLTSAAQNVSTSYKYTIGPLQLERIFLSGNIPHEFRAHMITLLEETPVPTVVMAVKEACGNNADLTPGKVLTRISTWADELNIFRGVW